MNIYAIIVYFKQISNFAHLEQFTFAFTGWLFVEKCSDGSQGWLPKKITMEVESDHKRAKNFKQRYQFLKALSEVNQTEA